MCVKRRFFKKIIKRLDLLDGSSTSGTVPYYLSISKHLYVIGHQRRCYRTAPELEGEGSPHLGKKDFKRVTDRQQCCSKASEFIKKAKQTNLLKNIVGIKHKLAPS